MKRLIPVFAVLLVGLWVSCSDENGPTNNGDTTLRLVANTTVDEPSLSSPDEVVWSSVDSVTVPVKMGNAPKLKPPKAAAIPPEILVKAIKKGGKLYLRLQWSDMTFDTYPEHFKATEINTQSLPPRVNFTQQPCEPACEDQIYVMFDGLSDNTYDVWNWRVLTTGGGGLGKGYTCTYDGTPVADAAGTATDSVVVENPPDEFGQPTYASIDTSEFQGFILYLQDTVNRNEILDSIYDPYMGDYIYIYFFNTTGWELDQKVPGWLIDSSFASLSDSARGSRWDIKAVSDTAAGQYHVVLCRKLDTGFSDDIVLIDSVKVTIGIFDNQVTFEPPSSNRGFSNDFWIILP